MSESSRENNFCSRKLDGGTESEFGRLISQLQEFTKVSSKQSRQSRIVCFAIFFTTNRLELAVSTCCMFCVLGISGLFVNECHFHEKNTVFHFTHLLGLGIDEISAKLSLSLA